MMKYCRTITKENKVTNQEVAVFIVESFIRNGEMKSCANCENWDPAKHSCGKFGTTPPIEIILYSCEKDWVMDIPF